MAGRSKKRYEVLRGFDYAGGTRQHEPGDIVDDLPAEFASWMVAEGTIREADPVKAGD